MISWYKAKATTKKLGWSPKSIKVHPHSQNVNHILKWAGAPKTLRYLVVSIPNWCFLCVMTYHLCCRLIQMLYDTTYDASSTYGDCKQQICGNMNREGISVLQQRYPDCKLSQFLIHDWPTCGFFSNGNLWIHWIHWIHDLQGEWNQNPASCLSCTIGTQGLGLMS